MVGQAPSPVLASEVGPLVVALRRSPLPIALGPWRTHRGSAILAGLATVAALILAAVALPAAHADGFPANPSFEQQGTGWTAIGPAGAVTWAEGRGSVGPGCLRLSNAWAVSDPASPDEQVKGWLRLSFLAQHLEGDASLAVAFVADIDSGPQPQLLLGPESLAAPGWRRVELEAFASPSKPVRLAFGSLGEGAWLIDEVRVQPFQPPACQPPDDAPQLMQTLPDGWEPDGLLDARARTLGTERELIVLVNGIEVSMPERVQVKRAHRRGLRIYAENRGRTDKQLTIAVQAPRGFYVPHRTVPIRGGTTLIDGSVQSLLTGRYLLRIEFRSADEVKAAPLVVECERSYPAFGAAWVDRPPTPAQLEATIALPLQLHQVPVSALSDDAQAQGLFVEGTELAALVAPPWSAEACEWAVASLVGPASFFGLHHQPAAEAFDLASDLTLALAQTLKARGLDAKLLTPPLDLRLNAGLSCPQEALQSLTQLAAQGVPVAATLRLPPLKAGTLAGLRIDGRSSREPLSCWVQLAERYDLSAIAATLRREDAGLPLFISELCAEPSGSPPLDALALARVIASTAYLGATAFTVCARPDDCPSAADALTLLTSEGRLRPGPVTQVLAELTRELAAARPAVVLKQTEHIGLHPRAAIGFRPFLRGSEALLALWNNTGATVQLAIELHCLPLDLHLLEIGVGGIRRHYTGVFRFSEEAQRLGRPVIFVELEPAEMNLLSMQLSNGHAGWLAGVDFKPPIPAPKRDKHRPFFEDRPW